tara:strand:- start:115 stop:1086 length:972 start_codon:yes stop_codon:yes gene_type:complete
VKNIFRIIIILNITIFSTSCSWLNEDLDSSNEIDSSLAAPEEKKNNEEALSATQEFQEKTSNNSDNSVSPPALQSSKKIESHYGILIEDLGMQIKKLRSELDFLNQEVYALKAQSQVWENPFSIYNKEIVLDNGTTVYGKIVYQDQEMIKVETLIGGLTIDRSTIVKVTENVVEILPKDSLSSAPMKNFIKEGAIIEIQESSPGSLAEIERKGQKKTANLIVLGSIYEKTDENGNTILSGEIKNIGKKRADFSKINFLFRMNWRGETKPLTSFAKGSIQDLGNGVISDASIEPESIGNFELFIPKSFGEFISYSYSLDWEQYE